MARNGRVSAASAASREKRRTSDCWRFCYSTPGPRARPPVAEPPHLLQCELYVVKSVKIRTIHCGPAKIGTQPGDSKALSGKKHLQALLAGKSKQNATNASHSQCGRELRRIAMVLAKRKDLDAEPKRGGARHNALKFPLANLFRAPALAAAIIGHKRNDVHLADTAAPAPVSHKRADQRIGPIAHLLRDIFYASSHLGTDPRIASQSA